MKKIRFLLGTAFLLAFTAQAQAIPASFNYTITSWFANTTFTSGGGTTSTDYDVVSWGDGSASVPVPNNRSAIEVFGNPSTLGTGAKAVQTGVVPTTAVWEPSVSLAHVNNAINGSDKTLLTTRLYTNISLTDGATTALDKGFYFDIKFAETPNSYRDGDPRNNDVFAITGVNGTPFTLATLASLLDFTYGGVNYDVTLAPTNGAFRPLSTYNSNDNDNDNDRYKNNHNGNNNSSLGQYYANQAGVDISTIGFVTSEGNTTTVPFSFKIEAPSASSASVVPEPSTMLLLGFGMVGLAGIARRKLNKNK